MKENINIWSFICSIICVFLFYTASTSGSITVIGIHPFYLTLSFTLITFVFGVIGFGGIQDWKGMTRSIATMMLTLGLSAYVTFILFVGSFLG
ncbi:hypothetical protein LC085_06580 [Bacillus tianshenii]|uniref:hypothetical protein n=1 Tax=Sutcliffiella tianshenii TaxID=1463404 RepID=UPI001CD26560|nr:hypothetical protein [Bacillus tianshenii]MCA1319575.1 hypothetical protein [Bacillus tianshenii]